MSVANGFLRITATDNKHTGVNKDQSEWSSIDSQPITVEPFKPPSKWNKLGEINVMCSDDFDAT